ncbi:MAG: DUF2520 domain-containing protein [Petrimonas sp.]|nr:DUF2520 domain-containing protein [Petrimonas sp.]
MRIVFIGSGNVATHLARALKNAGHEIAQVYSRTQEHAAALAQATGAEFTSELSEIRTGADTYVFSVKDDALEPLLRNMPETNGIWLHTAGSVPADIFRSHVSDYGVLYPLQTFSKKREVNFSEIPLFIEANNEGTSRKIEQLAKSISEDVRYLSSEKRQYLHLSAVFACNFSNHMYVLASEILAAQGIEFDVLKPLIAETAAKVAEMAPKQAQTGPAVRFDEKIIEKQIRLLNDDTTKNLYRLISESIHKRSKND